MQGYPLLAEPQGLMETDWEMSIYNNLMWSLNLEIMLNIYLGFRQKKLRQQSCTNEMDKKKLCHVNQRGVKFNKNMIFVYVPETMRRPAD